MNKTNIIKIIKEETISFRNKTAVKDGNASFNYEEMLYFVDLLSEKFSKAGILKNDIVAVQYPDSAEYIIICLAVLSINAVIAPVPMSMPLNELEEMESALQVNYLIKYLDSRDNNFTIEHLKKLKLSVTSYKTQKNKNLKNSIDNPAFIRFSSGTTGKSKGVLLSHKAVLERTDAANSCLNISNNDVIIWLLDMSFHFVVTILLFLRKGATIVICGNQLPVSLYEALNTNKSTFIYASPFHYKLLIESSIFSYDMLKHIRLAISTAMKLPHSTAEKFYRKFNIGLSEAYGIIEVGLPFIHYPFNPDKTGSVGKQNPAYRVKIENQDEKGTGQILLKGPGFFSAYLSPFRLFQELSPDRWFDTGDLGYIDKDGYLFIAGRNKNVINFAGMKVFPYNIETIIMNIPSIKDVIVYGEKHDLFGEIPCAKIVLKKDYDKDEEKEYDKELNDIRKYCYAHLVQYEVPKKFEFVSELPRTASGKIKR